MKSGKGESGRHAWALTGEDGEDDGGADLAVAAQGDLESNI